MRNIAETETNIIMEEIDGANFFDQIDDFLEFPSDGVDSCIFGSATVDYVDFPPVWSENSSGFSACRSHSASDLSAELSVPYEDIVQLEWLSTFVEDSFSGGGLTIAKPQTTSPDNKADSFQNQFQTSSPVSVLESSSSTVCSKNPIPVTHEKRARSKRPRPATFTPRPSIHLIPPTPVTSSESGNFYNKKRKIIKIVPPSENSNLDVTSQNQNQNQNRNQNQDGVPVRKCMHCEITKTPQWRAGPMGPKSLCNACGVRHKTGRLYPEYRPAASPTFVPSLHSNSHKKVLEMRGCSTIKPEA